MSERAEEERRGERDSLNRRVKSHPRNLHQIRQAEGRDLPVPRLHHEHGRAIPVANLGLLEPVASLVLRRPRPIDVEVGRDGRRVDGDPKACERSLALDALSRVKIGLMSERELEVGGRGEHFSAVLVENEGGERGGDRIVREGGDGVGEMPCAADRSELEDASETRGLNDDETRVVVVV